MRIPVLDKSETLDKHFKKLLEEQSELNHEIMTAISMKEENKANIIEETLDNIQVAIGILDYYKATEKDIKKHVEKLEKRGWKAKKTLTLEELEKNE